ncbi:hypothetical protein E2C01_079720 [Portunus trituberculatus]|uniref:Uncharacterized protein n=1 Tax=Portunus trituberculatus TaxID=210409 RepID=A0A5B7ITI9_PORTR|nr:hypothetical protein [Portunus trituberculatus]
MPCVISDCATWCWITAAHAPSTGTTWLLALMLPPR